LRVKVLRRQAETCRPSSRQIRSGDQSQDAKALGLIVRRFARLADKVIE